MRLPVTDDGVLVPRRLLPDVDEVEVRSQNGVVMVIPAESGVPVDDPIRGFGQSPVPDSITDASENLDRYVYGSTS